MIYKSKINKLILFLKYIYIIFRRKKYPKKIVEIFGKLLFTNKDYLYSMHIPFSNSRKNRKWKIGCLRAY